MLIPLLIRLYDRNELVFTDEFEEPVELGRQSEAAEQTYSRRQEGKHWRVVIARMEEQAVSRRHALIEPLAGGRVRVTNSSSLIPMTLSDGTELAPRASTELALPVALSVGKRRIHVSEADSSLTQLRGLPEIPHAPVAAGLTVAERLPALDLPRDGGIETESLLRWLHTIMGVMHTAASSSDFFDRAAKGVVDVVGLDNGRVVLFDGDGWRTEAVAYPVGAFGLGASSPEMADNWRPSRRVLSRLRAEKRTFWEEPESPEGGDMSLSGVAAVVAAPIIDRHGEVIGALYGERRQHGLTSRAGGGTPLARISKVDAMLVELLATGVAAGLARIDHEKAAMAARIQFEQFFTPELARELAARPDLLKGQERDVTLLFADVRGFSRVSERIGPAKTLEWIGDVMGTLSDCVIAHSGVLVDYIGDELIAMWGAPQTEPAHARLACRAAIEMLETIPEINARWEAVLGGPMQLGIGVNTGIAQVGNTGSSRKFKYGALGNTVNLASRVQGATKYLKSNLLVTGSTRTRLDSNFAVRLLCRVAVVNIEQPVELYELVMAGRPGWDDLRKGYEEALALFERQEFRAAARLLGNLMGDFPDDGPSLLLLSRVVDRMVRDTPEFDPVWRLPGK